MNDYPITHLKIVVALAVLMLIIWLFGPSTLTEPRSQSDQNNAILKVPIPLENKTQPELSSSAKPTQTEKLDSNPPMVRIIVQSGDNLSNIFSRNGLSAGDLQQILLAEPAQILAELNPGQTIDIQTDPSGRLISLRYQIDPTTSFVALRSDNDFTTQLLEQSPEIRLEIRAGIITQENPSLYQAGKEAGLNDSLIMELASLFQWDISFALDLREGDRFNLIYEALSIDGNDIGTGKLLGANFFNLKQTHTALYFQNSVGIQGYFDETGQSLRKAFIRDPVHFSYVSSSFNLNRKHPIHNKNMPHRGIDYAASRGTPVLAAGDGRVIKAERNEASGNFIVLQHGEQYTTKYLHLSKFSRGLKAGKRVSQGQTIGYVGATGWATGPHLHYEFLANGVHRNPRTVRLPNADPIPADEIPAFKDATALVLKALNKS